MSQSIVSNSELLRESAEEHTGPQQKLSYSDPIHELRIYQIELEAQNEALRAALNALRESENKYRLLTELAAECIFWISPEEEKMLYVSQACRLVFGRDVAEFTANPKLLNGIVHPDDRTACRNHTLIERTAESGAMEFRIIHRDGSVRWIERYSEAMHDDNGNYLGQRDSYRDISWRKQCATPVH